MYLFGTLCSTQILFTFPTVVNNMTLTHDHVQMTDRQTKYLKSVCVPSFSFEHIVRFLVKTGLLQRNIESCLNLKRGLLASYRTILFIVFADEESS